MFGAKKFMAAFGAAIKPSIKTIASNSAHGVVSNTARGVLCCLINGPILRFMSARFTHVNEKHALLA